MIGYEATIRELRAEIDEKDETIRLLRAALGSDCYDPVSLLRVRGFERIVISTLLRAAPNRVSPGRMATALTVSRGHTRREPVSEDGVKVALHKARVILRVLGVDIENIYGEGWRLDETNAARLRAALEARRR